MKFIDRRQYDCLCTIYLLAAGFEQKYLSITVCNRGIRQRPNTIKFNAQIGTKKRSPDDRLFHDAFIWEICNKICSDSLRSKLTNNNDVVPYHLSVGENFRETIAMVSSWLASFLFGNFHIPKSPHPQMLLPKTVRNDI